LAEIDQADAELAKERSVVADFYARLDALTRDTQERLAAVRKQNVGGNHQARSERDAFARMHEDRLAQLRDVEARLVFGRLLLEEPDTDTGSGNDTETDTDSGASALRYFGRIGLRDDDQHTMLVDWRAPLASAF
jgi:DNA helicase IV